VSFFGVPAKQNFSSEFVRAGNIEFIGEFARRGTLFIGGNTQLQGFTKRGEGNSDDR
jgi:hypothetical protein